MTAKQKQCLLAYLGYYTGAIDGIWGEKSQNATIDFQRAYMEREDVDGIFWAATEKRILEVIATGEKPVDDKMSATEDKMSAIEDWWKDIRYFTRAEFRCPCGKCGGFPVEPSEAIVRAVDDLRAALGVPVIIVPPDGHSGGSGVRCQTYNDSLPGSVHNSRHVKGKAVDFIARGKSDADIETYLEKIKSAGVIRYWYRISPGSYHMDVL